jgi:hypothetical protein
MLSIMMEWGRVEGESHGFDGFLDEKKGAAEIWTIMIAPLRAIDWDAEPAEEMVFVVADYSEGGFNGYKRVLQCDNFEEFELGLDVAEKECRLD